MPKWFDVSQLLLHASGNPTNTGISEFYGDLSRVNFDYIIAL